MTNTIRVFVFFSFVLSLNVQALDPNKAFHQYVLDAWSIEQGLPQITVHAITQDHEGYLWIGTQAGLARFDGVSFKTFTSDNTPELAGNLMNDLFLDSEKQLWIATYKGLSRYKEGQFISFSFLDAQQKVIPVNIQSVMEDSQGTIWASALDGLYRVKNQHVERVNGFNESVFALLSQHPFLWVGGKGEIFKVSRDSIESITLPKEFGKADVQHLLLQGDNLYLGTNQGLLVMHSPSGNISEFKSDTALQGYPIDALSIDSDQNIWVGTIVGLFRVRDGSVKEHVQNNNAHRFQQVISMFEDHEKNLWLGSYRDGIARVWNGRINRFSQPEGLKESLVWSIHPKLDGSGVWVGTNQGFYQLKDGQFELVIEAEALPHPTAYTIYEEPNQLWVGTRKGLVKLINGKVEPAAHEDFLSSVQVNSIVRDSKQQLWLGTSKGLFAYSEDKLRPIISSSGESVFVRPMVELKDGRLMVGTVNGLFVVEQDQLIPVGLNSGLSQSLDVTGILELPDGKLIISTISNGIFLFNKNRWLSFSEKDGLPVNESFTVLQDNFGHVWVSGFKGLYQVPIEYLMEYHDGKRKSLSAYMILSESGGLIGSQKAFCCNGAGNAKGFILDDILWYPTRDGVISLDTTKISLNKIIPNVKVERVKYGEQWEEIFKQNDLLLNSQQRDVTFDFTALSFQDPKSVLFEYRLIGYQSEWQKIEQKFQRRVNYTNLPPGNYSFQVKASNNAGIWNPDIAKLNFSISPYFYETIWFYLVLILSSGLVVVLWHRQRLQALKQKKVELELQIQKHTFQLEESNKKLQQAVTALEEISQTDQLTGLKNRRYLSSQLPADLAHFERQLYAIKQGDSMIFAVLDIDHFKKINDYYGHKAGDTILLQFANIIQEQVRVGDYAVRWGGEEFIIVFRPMPTEMGPTIIERIRSTIEQTPFETDDGKILSITCSIGFVEYPFFFEEFRLLSWEHTVELADHALYLVKEKCRNGWACFYPTETTVHSKDLLFRVKDNLVDELESGRLNLVASWQKEQGKVE